MKLILNRREAKEGLIFKSTVYYLDITLETTSDEMMLIKKHEWSEAVMGEGMFKTGIALEITVGGLAGKTTDWGFKSVEHLAYFESQIIENAKALKEQLEAAESFTSSGPREVEL
ncbi:hypothetical protein OAE19_00470 [Porticoccaceae bacterium]|nr:hypothetical protein [Porticoccaceae bacterium]